MSKRPYRPVDFTSGCFIVQQHNLTTPKVLLIDHKGLKQWLCPGGHIEEGENPEQAVLREVKEETGLEVELIGERPPTTHPKAEALIRPRFMDIHDIAILPEGRHRHVGLYYFAKWISGTTTLAADEHNGIKWFDAQELETLPLSPSIKYYAKKALEEVK